MRKFCSLAVSAFAVACLTAGCSETEPPPSPEQASRSIPAESAETDVTTLEQPAEPGPANGPARALPSGHMLEVPLIKQGPELKYGCEVTSLAMLLRYAGYDADKMTLAKQVPKDTEPLVQKNGDIQSWGNPQHGFVGDMTGKRKGFAVYNKPLETLMRSYMGNRTVNLTGQPFEAIIRSVGEGKPVLVWATGDFTLPTEWEKWQDDGETVVAPFDEHVVLIVGYDNEHVYVNDPLTGIKQRKVSRHAMQKSWEALGKQALSYR